MERENDRFSWSLKITCKTHTWRIDEVTRKNLYGETRRGRPLADWICWKRAKKNYNLAKVRGRRQREIFNHQFRRLLVDRLSLSSKACKDWNLRENKAEILSNHILFQWTIPPQITLLLFHSAWTNDTWPTDWLAVCLSMGWSPQSVQLTKYSH